MRKLCFLFVVFFTMSLSFVKAQDAMILDIEGTCENWFQEIYNSMNESGALTRVIRVEDENVAISRGEGWVMIGDVFWDSTTGLSRSDLPFKPEHEYFEWLEKVRSAFYGEQSTSAMTSKPPRWWRKTKTTTSQWYRQDLPVDRPNVVRLMGVGDDHLDAVDDGFHRRNHDPKDYIVLRESFQENDGAIVYFAVVYPRPQEFRSEDASDFKGWLAEHPNFLVLSKDEKESINLLIETVEVTQGEGAWEILNGFIGEYEAIKRE